jgi:hypothetical protein
MFKKEDIKILLDKRAEILKEINKLEQEYTALGNIISEILKLEERENDDGR